jgi:ribosomal-protein-alanine N-acetyltransferase
LNIAINPPFEFTTPRLVLRSPVLEDAPAIFAAYASKPHIPKFMSWVAHSDIEQTAGFMSQCISGWNEKSNFEFIIELRNSPKKPIGMIGMHPLKHGVGFGYVIAEEFWNQGITSEALTRLLDWSLDQDVVYRAQAFCDVENLASARVMEKAGMTLEGTLRRFFLHPNVSDEPRDSLMYAKVK